MQVLLSIGYEWLDVRPSAEVDLRGKLRDAINVPLMLQNRRFDPETVRFGLINKCGILHCHMSRAYVS